MSTKQTEVPERYSQGWLADLDGRYSLARDLRERFATVCNDLGGEADLSYMQRSLVERSLWLEYWLSQQERKLMDSGADFDVGKWVQATNSLLGIFNKLGLKRKARDLPSLRDYLEAKQ